MTNTFTTTIPHVLIQWKKGVYHAALEHEKEYWTACGEKFPANQFIAEFSNSLAQDLIAKGENLCKRCDRVGNSIADRD